MHPTDHSDEGRAMSLGSNLVTMRRGALLRLHGSNHTATLGAGVREGSRSRDTVSLITSFVLQSLD